MTLITRIRPSGVLWCPPVSVDVRRSQIARNACKHGGREVNDRMYLWWLVSSLGNLAEPFEHQLLTLGEAAEVLSDQSFARLSART